MINLMYDHRKELKKNEKEKKREYLERKRDQLLATIAVQTRRLSNSLDRANPNNVDAGEHSTDSSSSTPRQASQQNSLCVSGSSDARSLSRSPSRSPSVLRAKQIEILIAEGSPRACQRTLSAPEVMESNKCGSPMILKKLHD